MAKTYFRYTFQDGEGPDNVPASDPDGQAEYWVKDDDSEYLAWLNDASQDALDAITADSAAATVSEATFNSDTASGYTKKT